MEKLFKDRLVIISGGLGDIGRATALEFAKLGANLALCGAEAVSLATDFLAEMKQYSVACTYHQVDVTDAHAVQKWVLDFENTIGPPDIILPNAAIVTQAGVLEITPQQWSKELRVNLDGAFHVAQSAASRLLHHKKTGRIVFMGSWAGYTPHIHIPAYCVSKAGLRMLCKCMALELAPHNILVNELALGYVAAGLSGSIWNSDPKAGEMAVQKVPIKRVMSAKEVAKQVVYICHPENIHMTGNTVLVDGGLSLRS